MMLRSEQGVAGWFTLLHFGPQLCASDRSLSDA